MTGLNGPGGAGKRDGRAARGPARAEGAGPAASRRAAVARFRSRFRPRFRWQGPGSAWPRGDLIALTILILGMGLLCAYLAATPPTRFATGVARYPPTLIFHDFYGVETNAGGPYRWAKPRASLSFPLAAPATYRLVLTLGDAPAAVPRPVEVYASGARVATITPEAAARDYSIAVPISRAAWARDGDRALTVELFAPAFVPPGDQRPLGVLLTGIAVAPETTRAGGFVPLFAGALLVLATLYAAARLLGLSWAVAAGSCGALLAGFALLAFIDRSAALWVFSQPPTAPLPFGGLLIAILALAWLARAAWRAGGFDGGDTPDAEGAGRALVFWSSRSWPLLPVVILAGGLRFFQFMRLNLWFDEGATIRFAHLPWADVLGLHGQYEPHPPLYYAAVKLAELALPVASAGRVLSIVTGLLTIPVVYALATRLLGRAAALVAALILTLSPLHLWYSREARMYAPSALLVALAALALVGYAQGEGNRARRGWAVLFGVSSLLAMYVVYSSLYPLVALGLPLLVLTWRERARAAPLWITLGVAALGYLPWVPQLFAGVGGLADRSGALGPTPARLRDLLLAVVGLGGVGQRGESYYPGLWEGSRAWHGALLLIVALVATLGLAALARHPTRAALVVAALLPGTIVVAAVTSAYSPGFAPRTLLYTTLGWALLAGAAGLIRRPRWLMIVARLGIAAILLLSVGSLRAMSAGAEKQHYREAVEDGAVAATFVRPLVAIGYMTAFYDAYAPGLAYVERPYLERLADGTARPDALWLAYGEDPWEDLPAVRDRLGGLGFERLAHRQFGGAVFLDLFARRGATLGAPLPLPGGFADGGGAAGWQLPQAGARVEGTGETAELDLIADEGTVRRASVEGPARPGQLYIVQIAIQSRLTSGRGFASLSCLDAAGRTTGIASTEGQGNPGAWGVARAALWCPDGATRLRIDLDNRGVGTIAFRDARLFVVAPTLP